MYDSPSEVRPKFIAQAQTRTVLSRSIEVPLTVVQLAESFTVQAQPVYYLRRQAENTRERWFRTGIWS